MNWMTKSAEIVVIEPTGSETQVVLRISGRGGKTQDLIAIFRERMMAKPGETVHISTVPGAEHIFDADSGRRFS